MEHDVFYIETYGNMVSEQDYLKLQDQVQKQKEVIEKLTAALKNSLEYVREGYESPTKTYRMPKTTF